MLHSGPTHLPPAVLIIYSGQTFAAAAAVTSLATSRV